MLIRLTICLAALGFGACAQPGSDGQPLQTTPENTLPASFDADESEPPMTDAEQTEKPDKQSAEGVSDLPGAKGLTFQSLDDYLAHLEEGGHIDKPFWEQMKDGTYRWNTGRGMDRENAKTATRDELLEKYGFQE